MSFFEIDSSWDSDGDYFATGDGVIDSHPISSDESDSDDDDDGDDDDEVRRALRRQYKKSKKPGNKSAPDHGVLVNFGLRELPSKRPRKEKLDLKPGDIFFDHKKNQNALVIKKDSWDGYEVVVLFYAKASPVIQKDQLIAVNPYGMQNGKYVESFRRPLTLETLLFFVYEYSDKSNLSNDSKRELQKQLNSEAVRDDFQKLLREDVDTSRDAERFESSDTKRVSRMIGEFEKRF